MNIQYKEITSQLNDISMESDAIINLLMGYCKNNQENPGNGCLFDILSGLNYVKKYMEKARSLIEQIDTI